MYTPLKPPVSMVSKKVALVYIALALLYSVQLSSEADEYFVWSTTSTPCPSQPCYNLSEYVSNADQYFTSNTNFVLLEGVHYLYAPLMLNNITNVTLSGVNTTATIVMSAGASISCTNSMAITLSMLEIRHNQTSESPPSNMARGTLTFAYSTASISHCTISNGHGKNGGAININASSIAFYGSNLFEDNTADISGGAVFAHDSVVTFSGITTFLNNRAGMANRPEHQMGGGAVFASHTVLEFDGFSNFTGNQPARDGSSFVGGAIMVAKGSGLHIRSSALFKDNSGYLGAALFSVNSLSSFSGRINFTNNTADFQGGGVFAYSSNLSFHENVVFANNTSGYDGGAIYAQSTILKCLGNVTFLGNSAISRGGFGGGTYAVDSAVTVSGSIEFIDNIARRGGGMGFEGSATLVLQSPVAMDFYHNHASQYGGGIHFQDSTTTYGIQCRNITVEATSSCFFKVDVSDSSGINVRLNFTENTAISATSFNGGALEFCRVQMNEVQTDSSGYQFLQNVSTFRNSEKVASISSKPSSICFCSGGKTDCSGRSRLVSIERGRTFNLSLVTVGQLKMPGYAKILGFFTNGSANFRTQNYYSERNSTCHDVGFRVFTKEDSAVLSLHPQECSSVNAKVLVHIDIKPCPPGFNVTVNRTECECEQKLKNVVESLDEAVESCDIETGLIRRPSNSTWMMPVLDETSQIYRGLILYQYCPSTFCKQENSSNPTWLNFSALDTDHQCAPHRTGRVCGACEKNYSLVLGNFRCEICENRYLSLLLFFASAGVGLIAVLFALHMTVAAGTVNGFILYANIVHICRDIFFQDTTTILSIFIAWVNLDFGVPTCFYNGLDAYSYIWLQYAFPFYLWLLMGLMIVSSKYSIRVGRLFGSNPVAVLATVLLMSYSKIVPATVAALSYRVLEYPEGTKKVWRWDPNIPFFEREHIILAIAAICVIIFLLVPYVLLLLFGYRLQAFSGKRGLFWFNKFTPLLDAYYAPFRKTTRFWTGFLLLIRVGLFLTFTINVVNIGNGILISVSLLFTTIAVIPWLTSRIYERLYADALEASFILNICILSIASYRVQNGRGSQAIVTNVSVSIALVEFVGIVIFHAYLRLRKKMAIKMIEDWKCWKCIKDALVRLQQGNTASNEIVIEPVLTSGFVTFREPLLDDNN